MTKTKVNRNPAFLQLSGATLVMLFFLTPPSVARAQDANSGLSVQPAPLVRLTGVLEATKDTRVSVFPRFKVLIGDMFWLLHVCQVQPVIPAYLAEKELQKVSGLGLRLLAGNKVLSVLQRSEMRNHPIVLEGWLNVRAGVFRVYSARRAAESAKEDCSTEPRIDGNGYPTDLPPGRESRDRNQPSPRPYAQHKKAQTTHSR
jgi:hypothetical protein